MINISNCPDTGLTRKIEFRDLHKLESVKQVILRCWFAYFKPNGERVTKQPLKQYCDLVASDSYCDPQTGRVWSDQESADYKAAIKAIEDWNNTPEQDRGPEPDAPAAVPVTEFEFFMNLTKFPVVMDQMEKDYISARDQEGKLNK